MMIRHRDSPVGDHRAFISEQHLMRRIFLSGMLVAAFAAGGGWPAIDTSAQQAISEPQLDAFEQRVRDYLLKNPEVIMEALQVLQERRSTAQAEALKRTVAERSAEILDDPVAPVGGNPSGDVTLVEFFDYNCPYCRRVAPTVTAVIENDPDLRIVYKELPILGPDSEFAARAALAARNQGKYGPFHKALMHANQPITENSTLEIARQVGLDIKRLKRDMADPAIEAAIARNARLANALGITGTPGFVIGDRVVPGVLDRATLESLISRARSSS
jgi:protein-disulfide isomerase